MKDDTKKNKPKMATADKRIKQSVKTNLINKAFRSKVSTAIKTLQKSEQEQRNANLSIVYSLMDKGVKKGIFKQNKANRFKSRITQRLAAKA